MRHTSTPQIWLSPLSQGDSITGFVLRGETKNPDTLPIPPVWSTPAFVTGDRMKVFVKEAFPGNGRFHVTLDPNVSAEDLKRMKSAVHKKKARFARRKETADLVEGEEMFGSIVRVRVSVLSVGRERRFLGAS